MKTIGIDARLYHKTGVGVYIRNLLHELSRMKKSDVRYIVYVMAGEGTTVMPLPSYMEIIEVPYRWHTFAEQTGFLKRLYRDNLDLMHFTYFSYPILYRRPFVATMHDTILFTNKTGKASTRNPFLYQIKHFIFRIVYGTQLKNAEKIIVPTDTVRSQILSMFGTSYAQKIVSIHEGIDYEFAAMKPSKKFIDIPQPFVMYVGNFYPHKNVERMIRAFAHVDPRAKLVLVGPDDFFLARVKQVVTTCGIEDRIIYRPDCPLEELVRLYSHATALVHPSLSEGFGLPILEAMHFMLPVAASDIPVFHELLGKNYNAFNPEDEAEIATQIDKALTQEHTSYGSRLDDFSFEEMAHKTYAIYLNILG